MQSSKHNQMIHKGAYTGALAMVGLSGGELFLESKTSSQLSHQLQCFRFTLSSKCFYFHRFVSGARKVSCNCCSVASDVAHDVGTIVTATDFGSLRPGLHTGDKYLCWTPNPVFVDYCAQLYSHFLLDRPAGFIVIYFQYFSSPLYRNNHNKVV